MSRIFLYLGHLRGKNASSSRGVRPPFFGAPRQRANCRSDPLDFLRKGLRVQVGLPASFQVDFRQALLDELGHVGPDVVLRVLLNSPAVEGGAVRQFLESLKLAELKPFAELVEALVVQLVAEAQGVVDLFDVDAFQAVVNVEVVDRRVQPALQSC